MKRSLRSILGGLGFAALSYGAAALGNLAMRGRGSPDSPWFRALAKPSFQPPDWVFGPVWGVLYGAIAYSGYRIWRAPASPARTRALALWGTQLVLNAAWTPIFFGAHRPGLALAELGGVDAAAGLYAAAAARVDRPAAIAVAPYLAWLGFATTLNGAIVAKNG